MYNLRVTVTLTSDLVYRIIVSGSYISYYWCVNATLDGGGSRAVFWVTLTLNLTFDLVFRIIISGAYLFYNLR